MGMMDFLTTPDMNGKTVFEHALYKSYIGLIDPRNCERFDSFERFEILNDKDRDALDRHIVG